MPYERPQDSSPKKKTVSLYAPSIRRIDNSSDKNMFEFVGYLNVKALGEIEPMLPLDANPRLPNKKFLDMNNDLINDRYEGLVSNLTSNDDFDLFKYACNGLTIYASDGFYNNDTKELVLTFDNRHGGKDGLANGNHVYQAIRTMVKQERVRDDYEVFLRVIVKMPDPYKPASIEGNNTGLEIQENSVLDYKGEFDWIKAQLEKDNFAYKGRIGYFEGHPNTLIDIRDILCWMYGISVNPKDDDVLNPWIPKLAYSNKKLIMDDFQSNTAKYKKIRTEIQDLIKFRDYIQSSAWDLVVDANAENHPGITKLFTNTPGTYLYGTNKKPEKALVVGVFTPILAGARAVKKESNGKFSLEIAQRAFDDLAVKILGQIANRLEDEDSQIRGIVYQNRLWTDVYDKFNNWSVL